MRRAVTTTTRTVGRRAALLRASALVASTIAAVVVAGCDRWVVAHLRNDTGDTIGIVRESQGHRWCWSSRSVGLDTYRLAPHRWVRIGIAAGSGIDAAIAAIECDTIMLVVGGRARLVTRRALADGEIQPIGSTVFFLVKRGADDGRPAPD